MSWIPGSRLLTSLVLGYAIVAVACSGSGDATPTQPTTTIPAPQSPAAPVPTPPATPVEPAALASLSLNPSTVNSQDRSEGRVTLTSAAPDGGAVIRLSSSKVDVARTPATVTVAAGETSATFSIDAPTVTDTGTTVITASYGTLNQTATLTVRPPGLVAAFRVLYSGQAGSGSDVCMISSPDGSVVCEFDGSQSRGFPTRYHWTMRVAGNQREFSTTSERVTPQTGCSLFVGSRLDPWVEMEVSLRVERNGQLSASTTRTIRVGSLVHWNLSPGNAKGYCDIPADS
jgi:hypothetical protein